VAQAKLRSDGYANGWWSPKPRSARMVTRQAGGRRTAAGGRQAGGRRTAGPPTSAADRHPRCRSAGCSPRPWPEPRVGLEVRSREPHPQCSSRPGLARLRACVRISASSGLHSHPVSWPGLEPPDGDPGATHDLAQCNTASRGWCAFAHHDTKGPMPRPDRFVYVHAGPYAPRSTLRSAATCLSGLRSAD
jgi:hypothetical protein